MRLLRPPTRHNLQEASRLVLCVSDREVRRRLREQIEIARRGRLEAERAAWARRVMVLQDDAPIASWLRNRGED